MTWLLLLACARPLRGPDPSESGPILLGWRLIPGETVSYRHAQSWSTDAGQLERVEHWTYLVRDVDEQGVATLEGTLTALGVERGDTLTPGLDDAREAEKARLSDQGVVLRLARDGRLVGLEGPSWADGLSHRLLALQLSSEPVEGGAEWPDPVMARPYADLIPVQVEVRVEGRQTFLGLDERAQAQLQSQGAVVPLEGGPEIQLLGGATWDPSLGVLEQRRLEATMQGLQVEDPGRLTLTVSRLE